MNKQGFNGTKANNRVHKWFAVARDAFRALERSEFVDTKLSRATSFRMLDARGWRTPSCGAHRSSRRTSVLM